MPVTLADHLLRTLSWTIIHSLWQGLLLTVLAGLVVLMTRRSPAALRYILLCTLFFLFLGGVAASFLMEWNTGSMSRDLVNKPGDSGSPLIDLSSIGQWIENAVAFLNSNAQWIVLSWLIILLFKSGRMILDMLVIRRLRSHRTKAPVGEWAERVQALSLEFGITKKVSLVESGLVKVPIVVGHFKPLILVPLGIMNHMPPGEVESVLLHELAHIRRHDYLVNFIQRIAELFFFFNPGLLWVSSLIRVERENCCDDMAISHTQNKVQFVEALIRCKEHSLKAPAYALGLFTKKNLLLQRMTRMVYNRNKGLSPFETAFFILNLVVLFVLLSAMHNTDRPVHRVQEVLPVHRNHTVTLVNNAPVLQVPDKNEGTKRKGNPVLSATTRGTSTRAAIQKSEERLSINEIADVREDHFENRFRPLPPLNSYHEPAGEAEAQANLERMEALRVQSEKDRHQADKDREQSDKDRVQAERDRERADRDRAQAEKDRQQADRDREQARKEREQAMRHKGELNYQE